VETPDILLTEVTSRETVTGSATTSEVVTEIVSEIMTALEITTEDGMTVTRAHPNKNKVNL
jgi:hypothetical protein